MGFDKDSINDAYCNAYREDQRGFGTSTYNYCSIFVYAMKLRTIKMPATTMPAGKYASSKTQHPKIHYQPHLSRAASDALRSM